VQTQTTIIDQMKAEHESLVYINADKDKEMVEARNSVIKKKEKIKHERLINKQMISDMKDKYENQIKHLK
jgi:hypothetical protein